jgi:dTDP-4-amino-4,6-dideoxygalactose transaminase
MVIRKMIKLFDPHVTEDEVNAAREVLQSHNWASGAGTGRVKEFEEKFNAYIGSKDAVAVNSGTAALHLALSVLDVRGKDVLVPSLTFVSTAHAVVYNGGNPVFVDVDSDTMCMDPADVEKKITRKTVAIMPVHFGGMPCEMTKIRKITKDYGITIVDDAAHACGATQGGKKIGSSETMTCFSFHPVKNLSMPTGGAISINRSADTFKKRLNSLRWCGIDNRKKYTYDVTSVAPNYYMNEISAAIGIVQMNKLDRLNARRKEIAKRYAQEIKLKHKMPYSDDCVYHLYWIISNSRKELALHIEEKGIEIGMHYRPVHTMTAYRSAKACTPVTEKAGKRIVTLPIHANLSDDDVSHVIQSINSFS